MKSIIAKRLTELRAKRAELERQEQFYSGQLDVLRATKQRLHEELGNVEVAEKRIREKLAKNQGAFNIAQGILDFVKDVVDEDRQSETKTS